MDWYTCCKTFIKVVECKSFTQAAKELHTNISSISKRISWLENQLDTKLLIRTTRRQELSSAGEHFYNRIIGIINEWDITKREILDSSNKPVGHLRVATPTAGNYYVEDIALNFIKKYPGISVDASTGWNIIKLVEQKIDVYIGHINVQAEKKCQTTTLYESGRKMFASPQYLKKKGVPKSLADIQEHNCLFSSKKDSNHCWTFGDESVFIKGNFTSNNSHSLINAAIADHGVICVPEKYITKHLESKLLKPVLPQYQTEKIPLHISYPSDDYIPVKTKLFVGFLIKQWKLINDD